MSSSHCKTSLLTLAPLTLSPSMKTYILQLEDLQGKAGLCCHRKKLSSAQRITVPSFPASMPSWHGRARNVNNLRLLPIISLAGGCDWVGVCGPTGSLSSLEPSGRCFHHRRQLARHQSVPPSSCTPAPPHLLSDTRTSTCNTSTCTSYCLTHFSCSPLTETITCLQNIPIQLYLLLKKSKTRLTPHEILKRYILGGICESRIQ